MTPHLMQKPLDGFTIVELLIVVVVIAILASISVVAYTGIQGRASDSAIKSDLRGANNLIQLRMVELGSLPRTEADLSTLKLSASKTAYGNHLISGGGYNLLYCSTVSGYQPEKFAFIARSRSGVVHSLQDGQLRELPSSSWVDGWGTMCPAALNVSAGNSSTGIWLYENNIWKNWL